MITITIGNKEYKVKEAKTNEELIHGLKGVKNLPNDEGMLFYLKTESNQVTFTMKDMLIPLDIIFINQDLEVVDVKQDCQPGKTKIIGSADSDDVISYVLEVNSGSNIKVHDELDFEDDADPVMKVLAQDGSTQMELWGGERIVSRRETKILIKKAKKAEESQKDSDFKTLGRYMFKVLKGQDNRESEYVPAPN